MFVYATILIDLVDESVSELRLQTVRERELDQQLKQSAEREQKMKDDISRLEQQLGSATDRETSLKQQLKQSQTNVKQRDDLIKKGIDAAKNKHRSFCADYNEVQNCIDQVKRAYGVADLFFNVIRQQLCHLGSTQATMQREVEQSLGAEATLE